MPKKILAVGDRTLVLELISKIATTIECKDDASEQAQQDTGQKRSEAHQPFDCIVVVLNMPGKRMVELYSGVLIHPDPGHVPNMIKAELKNQVFANCVPRRDSAEDLVKQQRSRQTHEHGSIQTAARMVIETTRHHIMKNPRTKLDLRSLAEVAGVSPRHLSRLFRAELGMSPVAYVESNRVDIARNLLERTADPIKSVAYAAGFRSTTTFRRAFLRRIGVAPSGYRSQLRTTKFSPTNGDGSAS